MGMENLVPIMYKGLKVLTGKQIAELYEVAPKNIKENFNNAKRHFIEGEHFFKVSGSVLFELKEQVAEEIMRRIMSMEAAKRIGSLTLPNPLSTFTNSAILYTAKGAARHCKMVNSQKAWEVFGKLERAYFDCEVSEVLIVNAPAEKSVENNDWQREIGVLKLENALLKNQLPQITCSEFAVVYALLMSNGSVKIGMTSNLTERVKQIKGETGLEVFNFRTTPFLPRDEAKILEKELLERYSEQNLGGEFFSVRFIDVPI